MAILTRAKFEELADHHDAHCVTILLPTRRAGMEVKEGQDRIHFKQLLQEAGRQLERYDLPQRDIEQMLEPGRKLMEDSNFWRNLSDGLAVFISPHLFEYHIVPIYFESFVYTADHFYVKSLLPMFHGDGRFFILGLSLKNVLFYEGARHSVTEVVIDDLTPKKLEDVVGYDYEQKSLQYRVGHGSTSGGNFHGHGEGKEDRKEEILQFFRAVDKGLMKMLHDEDAPMVVVCLDYLFPIYREANRYQLMEAEHVSGNPNDMTPEYLHEQAWEVVRPRFEAEREERKKAYLNLSAGAKTSAELEEIIPAAIGGRIDTLFLQNRTDIYGLFEPKENEVDIQDEKTISNTSLLNLAAIHTFKNGGKVFLMEPEDMPEPDTTVNALFRY